MAGTPLDRFVCYTSANPPDVTAPLREEAIRQLKAGTYREWAQQINATRILPFDIDPDAKPEEPA